MTGWVKLHRSVANHKLWRSEPFTKGQAWVDLLMIANHAEGFVTTKNGVIISIQRGECGFSFVALADRWKWSRGKVSRFIKLLEKEKMIQQKKEEDRIILVICNYQQYQGGATNDTTNGHQTIQQTDTKRTPNDTTNGHKQEEKEEKNGKNEKKYPPELVEFVTAFQNHVSATLGAMAPKATESSTNTACQVLRLMTEKDGWTLDQIREVLRWALEDDFWSTNARSITGLRKRSKSNGLTKFQNMYAAWEKQRGAHARASNPDYAWLNDPNDINHFL